VKIAVYYNYAAGVHIGTQAFAAAGTNEWHILTWIKDADCDPVVEIMSRASRAEGRGYLPELRPPEVWWPSFMPNATAPAMIIRLNGSTNIKSDD